ncbi:hypothetical protein F2Q70_00015479 [Brassica cretica]|uniref:Uncharacterized protein n=1 Tax=Brassica cretica TaxID=69181 RepID=A0A8S9I116_BRACR|nr:hypothetical protein F2Q70_00015479 [Brassica cretica]
MGEEIEIRSPHHHTAPARRERACDGEERESDGEERESIAREREREEKRDGAREKGRARRLGFLVSGNSLQSFALVSSCAQGNGNGGVSNKLLSEVALDQSARMTLYTTLCGN